MNEKKKGNITHFAARFPSFLFQRLLDYQNTRPHMSLNALIVEAVSQFLDIKDISRTKVALQEEKHETDK